MEVSLKPISIRLGYDEREDRLVFFLTDPRQELLPLSVTRRTTGRLVDLLAQLLERTSTLAARSDGETRAEILMIEHQTAIAASRTALSSEKEAQTGTPNGGLPAVTPVSNLIERIDIKTEPAEFVLMLFTSKGAVATLKIGRVKLHQFIELVRRTVDSANWNITFGARWLNADDTTFSIN